MYNVAEGKGKSNNEVLEQRKKELLKSYLEPEAFNKMDYLKGSNPEKYNLIVSIIAQSVSSGDLKYKVTSEQIRNIIVNIEQRNEKTIEIRRK